MALKKQGTTHFYPDTSATPALRTAGDLANGDSEKQVAPKVDLVRA